MFKRIRMLLRNSFKGKLLLSISVCTIIPIIILGFSSYFISSYISKGKVLSTLQLSNNQIVGSIAYRLEQVRNVTESMDYEIYSFNNLRDVELTEYMDAFGSVRNTFCTYQRTFELYNISVYLDNGSIAGEEGLMFFNMDKFYTSGYYQDKLKAHRFNSQTNFMLLTDIQFPYMVWPEPVNIISCYKVVQNMNDREIAYCYFVNIECEELSQFLRMVHDKNSGIKSYIISKDGMYLAHTDDDIAGTYIEDKNKLQFLLECRDDTYESLYDAQYLVHGLDIPDCYLVMEVPDSYISANSYFYIVTIFLITLFLFVVAMVAVYVISEELSKRIRVISEVVHKYQFSDKEDRLSALTEMTEKDYTKRDEVDQLALYFKEMVNSYEENVQNIIQMSLKEEKLQYQLLQAKINPHFLYNILESIKACQATGRLEDAQTIITYLAQFYRGILKKTEDLIPIGEELEITRLYLEMEALCRNNSFTWEFIVDPDIECFLIGKFTLQPLLENCVLHGLMSSAGVMSIRVQIQYQQEDEFIIITITDDGRGIVPSRLTEIQTALAEKSMDERYYGICNVNTRLSLLTGGRSCIRLESAPNMGTKVIIQFPQML